MAESHLKNKGITLKNQLIETTIISYLLENTSRDLVVALINELQLNGGLRVTSKVELYCLSSSLSKNAKEAIKKQSQREEELFNRNKDFELKAEYKTSRKFTLNN